MNEYKVIYREVFEHEFIIDAKNPNDVPKVFGKMKENKELSFAYGELVDSGIVKIEPLDNTSGKD